MTLNTTDTPSPASLPIASHLQARPSNPTNNNDVHQVYRIGARCHCRTEQRQRLLYLHPSAHHLQSRTHHVLLLTPGDQQRPRHGHHPPLLLHQGRIHILSSKGGPSSFWICSGYGKGYVCECGGSCVGPAAHQGNGDSFDGGSYG